MFTLRLRPAFGALRREIQVVGVHPRAFALVRAWDGACGSREQKSPGAGNQWGEGTRLTAQPMRSPAETAGLLRAAQEGDVRSFEALVERHIPQIRRFARAFTPSDEDADDLAQEALIKVYKAISRYRGDAEFSTWVFAITRNCFLDSLKSRNGRTRGRESDLSLSPESSDDRDAADELLGREQERRRLWTAIAGLPPEFRATLVLLDIEGLSHAEVAAIERVPLGTVKSRQSRGRAHLRRLLAARDGRPARADDRSDGNHGTVAVFSAANWRDMS